MSLDICIMAEILAGFNDVRNSPDFRDSERPSGRHRRIDLAIGHVGLKLVSVSQTKPQRT